jgi:hypothetical protein
MRQFVAVRFRPEDQRTYTYANDGPPVTVGDQVKVPDNRSDGWKRVEVVAIVDKPRFECKLILGKVTGEDVDEKLLKPPVMGAHKPDLFGDR